MTTRAFFEAGEAAALLSTALPEEKRKGETLPQRFRVDSREVEPGDAFVALRGTLEDGHAYIGSAVAHGAAAVILEQDYYERNRAELGALDTTLIPVADPERSLAVLASAWLDRIAPKTVGITGSVGKTTTREFLHVILRKRFRTHAAVRSYNTLVGCGMTILSMPADTEVLILELGTNRPGEIATLVEHFPVAYGVVTEIVPAHLEGLKSLSGVLEAKMEIARSAALLCLFYNGDNELLTKAVEGLPTDIKRVGVGFGSASVAVSDVRQCLTEEAKPLLSLTISQGGERHSCEAEIFGKQHAKNLGLAFAVASELGVREDEICPAIAGVSLMPGRGGIRRTVGDGFLIDESYNANPGSVSQALKNVLELSLPRPLRRVAVLGGMRELGEESRHWHKVILSRASLLDEVYLIGDEWGDPDPRPEALRGIWRDVGDFMSSVDLNSIREALILVKGSRTYGLEALIPALLPSGGGK